VARHGYAADAPFIDTPRDDRYKPKRFGIESLYRLFEQAIATTTTRDPTVRLLYVVVSPSYRTSGGTFTTSGDGRGGRRLWWWPYKEFVNMIRRCVDGSRCVGPSPRIGHLTTDSTANHRPSKPARHVASAADRRRQRQPPSIRP